MLYTYFIIDTSTVAAVVVVDESTFLRTAKENEYEVVNSYTKRDSIVVINIHSINQEKIRLWLLVNRIIQEWCRVPLCCVPPPPNLIFNPSSINPLSGTPFF